MNYYNIVGKKRVNIVIEMGLGACLEEWMPFAQMLSEENGVLLYERAGVNRSELSQNARTPMHIAKELYELLKQVEHEDKIILIAHSQGGLYAQQFCRLYPEMVKGVVLLDPLSAQDNVFKEQLSAEEYKKSGVDKSTSFVWMKRLAKWKLGGLTKKLMKSAPPFYYYNFQPELAEQILNSYTKPSHGQTALEEYQLAHVKENVAHLAEKSDFPDIPLALITHTSELAVQESMQFGNNSREFAEKVENMWQNIMKEYLSFSKQSRLFSAQKSSHYIHLMEPEIVLEAYRWVAEEQ